MSVIEQSASRPSRQAVNQARYRARLSMRKHPLRGVDPTSGVHALQRTLRLLGTRALDGRSVVSKTMRVWRETIIADLGGHENLSENQRTLVDLIVRQRFLVDSLDAWILEQGSLVDADRKAILPAVVQRQALADGLARYLHQLGLERRARPVESLPARLAREAAEPLRPEA